METQKKKKIVVIGGGTGTYTILSGLKSYTKEIDITAIVTMADSGGSTGRLRDEFGQLPVGDVRMALAALAPEGDDHVSILRELFLYRFNKGEGLAGHNFGNLLLTALTDIVGSTSKAVETASTVLRVAGEVVPVTSDNGELVATYGDGLVLVGEHNIDTGDQRRSLSRIVNLAIAPVAVADRRAVTAILAADLVILGPGDLYTSLLANCVVTGISEALGETKAKIVYVANLMSRVGQTVGMHTKDYLDELEKYIGRRPDFLLFNKAPVRFDLVEKYQAEGNHLVENNCTNDSCQLIAEDVVATEAYKTVEGDRLTRSLVRHDSKKLARAVIKLLSLIKTG